MEQVFLTILNMSITSCYVMAAVMLCRLLLRKAPKKYTCILWSIVGFRLICPFSFPSAVSLFRLFDTADVQGETAAKLQYIPAEIAMMETPQVSAGIPAVNAVINGSLPAAVPEYSVSPIEVRLSVGSLIWIAGILLLLAWSIIDFLRLVRRMRTATLAAVQDAPGVTLWESENVRSPFILGILHPAVYLPYGLDPAARRYVLTHEAVHLKRFDHLTKPLAFLILTVHWFNPLCWLAFYLFSRDLEMSCDEAVLEKLSTGDASVRKAYSTTLLAFASNYRLFPLAFGEISIKSRIRNALNWKKPGLWITFSAFLLCIAAVFCLAGNPLEQNSPHRFVRTLSADDIEYAILTDGDSRVTLTESERWALADRFNGVRSREIRKDPGTSGFAAQASLYLRCTDSEYGFRLYTDSLYFTYKGQNLRITSPALTDFILDLTDSAAFPFDSYYIVQETLFTDDSILSYPENSAPLYYHLSEKGLLSRTNGGSKWIPAGTVTETTLTKNNFDIGFVSSGRFDGYAASLRKDNKQAWQCTGSSAENTSVILMLLQEDNEICLIEGTSTDGVPVFHAAYRLQPIRSAPVAYGCAVWTHDSSGFPFRFGFPHTEIHVTASEGTLTEERAAADGTGEIIMTNGTFLWPPVSADGKNVTPDTITHTVYYDEIIVTNGAFCWHPVSADGKRVTSDTLTFTVYDHEKITHTGTLTIKQNETTSGPLRYTAVISGENLIITQEAGSGVAEILAESGSVSAAVENPLKMRLLQFYERIGTGSVSAAVENPLKMRLLQFFERIGK